MKAEIGDVFKLRKDTDKSDWAGDPSSFSYRPYTVIKIYSGTGFNIVMEREKMGGLWNVNEEFLAQHFTQVVEKITNWKEQVTQ